jgi:hypothetical protein
MVVALPDDRLLRVLFRVYHPGTPFAGIAGEQIGFQRRGTTEGINGPLQERRSGIVFSIRVGAISQTLEREQDMDETTSGTNPIEEEAEKSTSESSASELPDSVLGAVVGGDKVAQHQPAVDHKEFTVTKLLDVATPKL